MQEYLNTSTYEYKLAHTKPDGDWVCIPEGAEIAIKFNIDDDEHGVIFYKNDGKAAASEKDNFEWDYSSEWSNAELLDENFAIGDIDLSHKVLWVRPTKPEALPFIDDDRDMINSPSHYTQGKVECIDAIESATVGKTGIDAVCVANIIKYLWRYEEKNGIEDIKKAEWYLQKLIENNI